MKYDYYCEKCEKSITIEKKMSEASKAEKCEDCKKELKRIYSSTTISTGDGMKLNTG